MKTVEFLKVGLQNFCCHIDPVELEFGSGKLTMITGVNGSGKTAIIQALPYSLYGVCEKGRGEDVLNNKTKKNCHTFTEFKIDDKEYRVDRYVKFTRKGNTVTLSDKKDTKWNILFKGQKEVLPEIERLLMPYKLFINTLLFSQKVKTFFTDLTDSEQKEIFRKILKLDDYILYQKQAVNDLKKINTTITKIKSDSNTKNALINSNLDEIETLKSKKIQFENEKKEVIFTTSNQISGLESKIFGIEKGIKEYDGMNLENGLSKINEEVGSISQKLNSLSEEVESQLRELNNKSGLKASQLDNKFIISEQRIIEKSNKGFEQLEDEYNDFKIELDNKHIQFQNQIIKFQNEQYKIETNLNIIYTTYNELNESLKMKGGKCPTCHQNVGDEAEIILKTKKSELKLKSDNNKQELLKIEEEQNELTKQQTKIQQQIKELKNELNIKKREIKSSRNEKITKLEGKLEEAKNKLDGMVETYKQQIQSKVIQRKERLNIEYTNYTKKKEVINELINKKEELVKSKNEFFKQLATNKAQLKAKEEEVFDESSIDRLNEKCELLKSDIAKLEFDRMQNEKFIKVLEFWKVGFSSSGIQSMLIDEAIPFMNKRASYYLDKLSNGRYKVVFDTLKATKDAKEFRDKISVEVFDTLTHSDKRIKFSGGQERLVDIATILTLSDLQSNIQDVSFNLLLFDEIFDSLDDENIGNVSGLIRQIASEKWIGLISHRHIDQIDVDDIIKLY